MAAEIIATAPNSHGSRRLLWRVFFG